MKVREACRASPRQPASSCPSGLRPRYGEGLVSTDVRRPPVDFSRIPVFAGAKATALKPIPGKLQRKLTVGPTSDPLERDADRIADAVMRPPQVSQGGRCACGGVAGPSGECDNCRAKREAATGTNRIARSATGRAPATVPRAVHNVVASPGRPLDSGARGFMEPRFGRGFGDVRIHDDAGAASSAALVGARAYAVGRHVVFGAGQYAPAREPGQRLLAHELAHVVQQDGREPALMRKALPFDSTIRIRHQVLKGETNFDVKKGALAVTADTRWHLREDESDEKQRDVPRLGAKAVCGEPAYEIAVTQVGTLWDSEYGSCSFASNGPVKALWNQLPEDTYYLTISTGDHNPACVLEGEIRVEELSGFTGKTCTQLPPGPLEMLHDALNIAGLIPALGAIPDGINAGIYLIEGDWANAGFSVAAAIPFLGDAFQVARQGEKLAIKVAGKDVERLGAKKIGHALEEAKAGGKAAEGEAKAAPKEAVREAEEAGKAGKGTHVPVPGLRGCRIGSLHCPLEYLSHEFADLFNEREKAEFARYLRKDFDHDLNMGRSLRNEQTILTGDPMYAQFMAEVPRSQWSEPFREALDSGRTRPLEQKLRWPIDDVGSAWVVHHDPPLGWVTAEGSKLWHPMPYRVHDDAHKWWSQLQKQVKARIPKGEWARILEEGGSIIDH